jgi:L-alanine-DL-glutamate epimerase-like enolase superfamily enzyme
VSAASGSVAEIVRVEAFRVDFPVVKSFVFASGTAGPVGATAAHVFVKLTDSDGRVGWGESRPSPGWSYETAESVLSTIHRYLGPRVLGLATTNRRGLHERMHEVIGRGPSTGQPGAKCAIDMALHDLAARAAGLTLRAYLGGSDELVAVSLSYTLTAHDPVSVREDVAEGKAAGFERFNYKLGVRPESDLNVAEAIRESAGPDAFVWADANQSVPPEQARRLVAGLVATGTDVLEQPFRADAMHLMPALRASTSLALALDESIVSPTDLLRAVSDGATDYLVVKLARTGGVWPTWQQLAIAEAAQVGVLISGLTESMLAKVAACQVAAAAGCDGPAGLNGSQFVVDREVFPDKDEIEYGGRVQLGSRLGIGIAPDEAALRSLALESVVVGPGDR